MFITSGITDVGVLFKVLQAFVPPTPAPRKRNNKKNKKAKAKAKLKSGNALGLVEHDVSF